MPESELNFLLECIELSGNAKIVQRINQISNISSANEIWKALVQSFRLYDWVTTNTNEISREEALRNANHFGDGIGVVECDKCLSWTFRYVVGLGTSASDPRFLNVESDHTWLTIAYKCVDELKDQVLQLMQATKFRYDEINGELFTATREAKALSITPIDNSSAIDKSFEPVRKYFISEPSEVMKIIRAGIGKIRMSKLLFYEAALLLEPLKEKFDLNGKNAAGIKILIEDQEERSWFGDTKSLRSNLKSHGGVGSNSETYMALSLRFSEALMENDLSLSEFGW